MPATTIDREKDAVDLVTNCMITLDFLEQITLAIGDPRGTTIPVGDFYNQWRVQRQLPEHKPPFNLGVLAGYLYCGLLLTGENWQEVIPDERIEDLDAAWGLQDAAFTAPKNMSPKLRYVIRRLRNSLGHANFHFNVPADLDDPRTIHQRVSVTFQDTNARDKADTFDTTLRLEQLECLIKQFQATVHATVRIKT